MQSDRHARSGSGAPSGGSRDPLLGRVLDRRYLIGSRIARGGMASVYEATDLRLDRTVAVKVMHAGLGDDDGEFAARFVREARSAARLSHPNVVAVFDQGDDDGTVFLAMELVAGHTLRDTISKESPMSPLRALALLEPVLSALAAAHRAGIIHRDIKPENVLIADDGRVKVADFGLAKAISADTQHTVTGGVLIGTVSYLAPELVVDGRADARADVYAAGVLLYELLTGVKPHAGESPIQVAYKHVHEDVPAPSLVAPGIPAYVDALVARATARDRTYRPADASVLLHQVHRVSHALAAGVREDADLTADLAPRRVNPDTAPEPWDPEEMAALLAPSEPRQPPPSAPGAVRPPPPRERTTTLLRPDDHDGPADPDDTVSRAVVPAGPPRTPKATRPPKPPRPPRERREKRRRSKRGPILLVLALLVAGCVGAGAWWFGYARYTTTPGVIGLSQAQAEKKLERAGLDVEVGDTAYSDTVPVGMVTATDPGAGGKVLDGGSVTITVSQGEEVYDVPAVKGMNEDQAQDAIGEHFEFGTSTGQWSEKVAEGVVLRSKPQAGATRRPGTAIDIVVSQGRRPIPVASFVGEDADDAQEALEGKKLSVDRTQEEYSDTVPAGDVISQSPSSGTLFRGDTVQLVVSRGPELVAVPDGLIASGVDAATEKLEALGFKVEVENAIEYIGIGYVFKTSPGSGDLVPRGSTIILYLI